ncbi:uncharacterized protein LOC105228319 isoform X1 [Bactrocera dorsalis]|uniref:Uncharacterized protein LOC105228319 isoform X1 n=3 Tax=Endopterygota TaxID=33392 RepID=A0A6I9VAY0_BACDO|nr:uncharacterized protein LOC105228319 isoform X1 [Bactrocera dorsalis]
MKQSLILRQLTLTEIMKVLTVILLICLANVIGANKVVLPKVNYEGIVDDFIKEAQEITIKTANALESQYKIIVVEPTNQVDAVVQNIEDRREESPKCVEVKDPEVQIVVDSLHDEINVCGAIAVKTSAGIMNDVNAATQQIVLDGYDVLKLYQKCKNYKNSVLKNSCYAKLSIKVTLYIKNSRRSINTIKGAKHRVPAVFSEADDCTHTAADLAIVDLNAIHTDVVSCINENN